MFQVLLRETKCNPVLIGSHGTGRRAALAEVIRRMAIGDAPGPLPNRQVIMLDHEALLTDLSEEIFCSNRSRLQICYKGITILDAIQLFYFVCDSV